MPIPDNEFSNDYQEVAEEHNVSASMAQSGLKCKYDRLLVRLKEIRWELHSMFGVCYAKYGEVNIGQIYIYLDGTFSFHKKYYGTLEEAKKALEDWFIYQIGEGE